MNLILLIILIKTITTYPAEDKLTTCNLRYIAIADFGFKIYIVIDMKIYHFAAMIAYKMLMRACIIVIMLTSITSRDSLYLPYAL